MGKNEIPREGPKKPIPTVAEKVAVVPTSGHMLEISEGTRNVSLK
jgi:hypothetical protein